MVEALTGGGVYRPVFAYICMDVWALSGALLCFSAGKACSASFGQDGAGQRRGNCSTLRRLRQWKGRSGYKTRNFSFTQMSEVYYFGFSLLSEVYFSREERAHGERVRECEKGSLVWSIRLFETRRDETRSINRLVD